MISIIFIALFSIASWFFSPKGENRTVWRSTLILSAWSCWLMWGTAPSLARRNQSMSILTYDLAITFLAQWHPLMTPERNDLRPEYVNGPAKSGSMF